MCFVVAWTFVLNKTISIRHPSVLVLIKYPLFAFEKETMTSFASSFFDFKARLRQVLKYTDVYNYLLKKLLPYFNPPILYAVFKVWHNFTLQKAKKQRYRFATLVEELRNTDNVEYTTNLLELINCIIVYAEKIQDRVRIRNEFFGEPSF